MSTIDKTLNCSLFVASESKSNQVEINYGDNSYEKIDVTSNDLSNKADDSILLSNDSIYMLLNSEFLFETLLYGFDIWSANKGKILIEVFY